MGSISKHIFFDDQYLQVEATVNEVEGTPGEKLNEVEIDLILDEDNNIVTDKYNHSEIIGWL